MQTKWPWFERQFSFDFPATKLPDLIERLDGTDLRLAKAIAGLPTQTLHFREADAWSIQENIGHLGDVEPLWIGRIADIVARHETMRAADLTNQQTFTARHNDSDVFELIERFRKLRGSLLETLGKLSPDAWSLSALHPRLKNPMRIVDLCLFVADHDDYHLARIRYLKSIGRQNDSVPSR